MGMDVTKGAGKRLMAEFNGGKCHYDAASRSFQNKNGQAFFITSEQRIMRYDSESQLYNVFDAKKNDFVPCAGLHKGETVTVLDQGELFNALLREQYWGDFFVEKGANFACGAGKQILILGGSAVVGGAVAPFVSKGAAKLADKWIPTPPAPVAENAAAIKTGIATTSSALKQANKGAGLTEHAARPMANHMALNAVNHQIINPINPPLPRNPFCPVERWPWRIPTINPAGPCFVDPNLPFVPPWNVREANWWQRGLFSGGSTASGAGVGFLIGGPVGGAVGTVIGAGIGALL